MSPVSSRPRRAVSKTATPSDLARPRRRETGGGVITVVAIARTGRRSPAARSAPRRRFGGSWGSPCAACRNRRRALGRRCGGGEREDSRNERCGPHYLHILVCLEVSARGGLRVAGRSE